MKNIILISISLLLLVSCGHKGDKNDPLYKEVMAIHDDVMPKLSTIHKLKKTLRKLKPSPTITSMLIALEEGDEAMMVWMSEFDPPAEQPTRKPYLEKELKSVKIMADKINNSIAIAENYLANTPSK